MTNDAFRSTNWRELSGVTPLIFAQNLKQVIDSLPVELKMKRDGSLKLMMKPCEITETDGGLLVVCPVWHRQDGQQFDKAYIQFEVNRPKFRPTRFRGQCTNALYADAWDAILLSIDNVYPPWRYRR